MEQQIVNLLWVLICICYLGIGYISTLVLETAYCILDGIEKKIEKKNEKKEEEEKKEEDLPWYAKIILIFFWPIVLLLYILCKINTEKKEQ